MPNVIDPDKILCKPLRKKLSQYDKSTLQQLALDYNLQGAPLRAVFDKLKLWTNKNSITIGFLVWEKQQETTTPEPWRVAWTCWVVKTYIQPYVGLILDFTTDFSKGIDCDVRITFDPDLGSYSLVGTDCLDKRSGVYEESTNIGWIDAPAGFKFTYQDIEYTIPNDGKNLTGGGGLVGGTILHEFGHILGMIHEHQSPFGVPFHWNRDQVIAIFSGPPNYWDQETIIENFFVEYDQTGIYNGSNFDPTSIMKYSFGDGTKLLDRNAYYSTDKYINATDYLEKVNITLSPLDKYWLQKNYPGGTSPPIEKPSDAIDYDQRVSWFRKLEFFLKNLDENTKRRIITILVILLITTFLYDFYNFFTRTTNKYVGGNSKITRT
jgi:hypothetical protein